MRPTTIYVNNSINNLKNIAKANGFKIVYRAVETNCGDFCIFIYKPGFCGNGTKYLVGFDGDWDAPNNDNRSFDSCWNQAYDYMIKNHKN